VITSMANTIYKYKAILAVLRTPSRAARKYMYTTRTSGYGIGFE